jgi:tetratricopeptide (TPR) repeat protein
VEAVQPERLSVEDVELLEADYTNIRAALGQVIERRQSQPGLQIGHRLWVYWYIRGQYAEGCYWLGKVLSISNDDSASSDRARCLLFTAHLNCELGDLDAARPLTEAGRDTARAVGDSVAEGIASQILGTIARGRGDLNLAASFYREAATIWGQAGSWVWQAGALDALSSALSLQGNDAAAEACARETLEVIRQHGLLLPTAGALETLGMVAMRRGHHRYNLMVVSQIQPYGCVNEFQGRNDACRFRLGPFDVSLKPANEEHVSTMSATATSLPTSVRPADSATSVFSWGGYARTGLLTIGASVLANAVLFYLAQVGVPYNPAFLPLGDVSGPIIFTVFPAVVATLLYAGLLRFVRAYAAMVFTVIAAITFVVTLIPDFTYIPTVDGVSNAEIGVLVTMHVIAAAVITRGLTTVRR